jgi:hypothetical protein
MKIVPHVYSAWSDENKYEISLTWPNLGEARNAVTARFYRFIIPLKKGFVLVDYSCVNKNNELGRN